MRSTMLVMALGAAASAWACIVYRPLEPSLLWHPFQATAYCDRGFTASGVWVREGVVASDPRVLPLGSEIDIRVGDRVLERQRVMDTGGKVRGYTIDIWMPACEDATRFGRREVKVRVRRRGDLRD
jgi:3D (Asp-Asp-Asp) domain-containing protein